MKKKLYYPTPEEARRAHEEISELCEKMAKEKIPKLGIYERWIDMLHHRHPGSAEFLELEPEEMVRRHKMGIEAAKVLVLR